MIEKGTVGKKLIKILERDSNNMLDELRTTPTIQLINGISEWEKQGNQAMVNILAYELACRIYIPNDNISFENMLADFGYKKLDKEKRQQKKLVKS